MASRKEEKERLRQERLEAEEAAKRKQASQRRLWIVGGGVLAAAAIAAVVVLVVSSGGGGGDSTDTEGGKPEESSIKAVAIPAQAVSDLNAAAKAAGCKVGTFPSEGRDHTDNVQEKISYKTNPPTSGKHYVQWAEDGDYSGQDPPPLLSTVHALEHGRINFQYKPGTDNKTIGQLKTLFEEQGGYHTLLFENQSGMKEPIAATAWTHSIVCPQMNDKVWDALRAFRARYTDQGPETVA